LFLSLHIDLKNSEILIDRNGFKRSESEFDTNKTNPFLSISIHFHLLEWMCYLPEISMALHSTTCTFCAHRGARVPFKRGHFSGPLDLSLLFHEMLKDVEIRQNKERKNIHGRSLVRSYVHSYGVGFTCDSRLTLVRGNADGLALR